MRVPVPIQNCLSVCERRGNKAAGSSFSLQILWAGVQLFPAAMLVMMSALVSSESFKCKTGVYCRSRGIGSGIFYDTEAEIYKLCRLEPRCTAYDFNTIGGYGRLCSGTAHNENEMFDMCILDRPARPPPPPPPVSLL